MPGIGTAIGAIGGGLIGGFLGGTDEAEMSPEERQARQMQLAHISRLQASANGGPNVATERMVEHNRAENAASQVGYAKTLGGDPALANRMAAEGIARGNAESAYQGQQLAAQEQHANQQLLAQTLNNLRAADAGNASIQTAVHQANLDKERAMYGSMMNNAAGTVGGFF
jgi:hypothetical protein